MNYEQQIKELNAKHERLLKKSKDERAAILINEYKRKASEAKERARVAETKLAQSEESRNRWRERYTNLRSNIIQATKDLL